LPSSPAKAVLVLRYKKPTEWSVKNSTKSIDHRWWTYVHAKFVVETNYARRQKGEREKSTYE
jgi:hypothetical protein